MVVGIIAYSSSHQLTCIPELLINSPDDPKVEGGHQAAYFKLPLVLSTLLACTLKCCFGIAGAMVFDPDNTNIFSNLLFHDSSPDSVLYTLTAFMLFVVLPQAIDQ